MCIRDSIWGMAQGQNAAMAIHEYLMTDAPGFNPRLRFADLIRKADLLGKCVPDLSLIHISEPTRRTPISYAVFCLKKKRKKDRKKKKQTRASKNADQSGETDSLMLKKIIRYNT